MFLPYLGKIVISTGHKTTLGHVATPSKEWHGGHDNGVSPDGNEHEERLASCDLYTAESLHNDIVPRED